MTEATSCIGCRHLTRDVSTSPETEGWECRLGTELVINLDGAPEPVETCYEREWLPRLAQ